MTDYCQESINGHRSLAGSSLYGKSELGLHSGYSNLADDPYLSYNNPSRSLGEGGYTNSRLGGGGYGSSGLGDYSSSSYRF